MDCSPFSLFQIIHELERLELNFNECVDDESKKRIQDEMNLLKQKAMQIQQRMRNKPINNTMNIQPNHIFTPEQLALSFNGKNGNPLYITVDGLVFDVSENDYDNELSKTPELEFLMKYAVLVGHVKDF